MELDFTHFNFVNFMICMLGATFHVVVNIVAAVKKDEFSLAILLTDRMNYLRLILVALSILTLLLGAPDVQSIIQLPAFWTFFLIGWFNFNLIERIVKIGEKNINKKA